MGTRHPHCARTPLWCAGRKHQNPHSPPSKEDLWLRIDPCQCRLHQHRVVCVLAVVWAHCFPLPWVVPGFPVRVCCWLVFSGWKYHHIPSPYSEWGGEWGAPPPRAVGCIPPHTTWNNNPNNNSCNNNNNSITPLRMRMGICTTTGCMPCPVSRPWMWSLGPCLITPPKRSWNRSCMCAWKGDTLAGARSPLRWCPPNITITHPNHNSLPWPTGFRCA